MEVVLHGIEVNMPKYKVEYSDSVVVEADSEQEAIHEAWQQMFCDGPKDYCFYANEGDDDDDFDIDEDEEDDDAEVVVLEHGKIYDCSYFDDDMNWLLNSSKSCHEKR